MKLDLYRTSNDNRALDKRLAKIATINCHVKENTSIFEPVFIIAESTLDKFFSSFNYIRCSDFGRYYFIKDLQILTGGEVMISCKCDVLSSFKSYIRNSTGAVFRNEFVGASDIVDSNVERQKKPSVIFKNYNATPFKAPHDNMKCVAITTTGGIN